jgi:AraC family transcriptional regulator
MSQRTISRDDPLEPVLAYIEVHLEAPEFASLNVGALAAVAELSPFHFSRLFTARMGESIMSHVRRRRMLRAATLLRAGAPSLIDLAFDCGFESQEAFTRAFKQIVGVTPGRFRREAAAKQSTFMEKAMNKPSQARPNVEQLGDLLHRDAFLVAGLSAAITAENKSDIPALWPKLMGHIPFNGQVGNVCYGVCYGADMKEGKFNYMAAAEIAPGKKPPADLTLMQIPAQTYMVFRIVLDGSEIHPQMQAAMKYIWSEGVPKSGKKPVAGIDLETYDKDFNPEKPGSVVDFCIPVEG